MWKILKKISKKNNIEILDQIIFSSRKAEVRTRIKYNDKYIPINYRFVLIGKQWKIYDVYVEGVSLIKNYRSQFKDMLLKKSPKEVINELRLKLKDTKCGKGGEIGILKFRVMCGMLKKRKVCMKINNRVFFALFLLQFYSFLSLCGQLIIQVLMT